MLRIYTVALEVAQDAGSVARAIGRHDADLARQLRRAAASVVLNVAEAAGSERGNRRARFENARGSAYEVRACFDVAEQLGYVAQRTNEANERLKHVIGALHLLVK